MGDKSEKKKMYILEEAGKVFKTKGYKSVTMKDIVEACNISRGGLYLYYDSTENLFRAVLKNEQSKNDPDIDGDKIDKGSYSDLLALFFLEQKKDILNNGDSLLKAMYEYSFYKKELSDLFGTNDKSLLLQQKEAGVKFLTGILRKGNETKEFEVDDPDKMSRHIVYTLEGMKILSRVENLKEKDINDEMVILYSEILPKKDNPETK